MNTNAVEKVSSICAAIKDLYNRMELIVDEVTGMANALAAKEREIKEKDEKMNELIFLLKSKEEETEKLKSTLESSQREIVSLKEQIMSLERSLKETKEKLAAKDEELSSVLNEKRKLEEELNYIKEQLSRLSKMYREITKEKEEIEDVRHLLSIYITLLEEVFGGQPHAKVLYLLHGDKNIMKRKEITEAAGFQPAIILKSIYDLAKANLVEYDLESEEVRLVRRIY
ncbi:MAG: hypothetical protein QXK94_00575 [Candidatus Jordarchaeales archaeon]